MQKVAIVADSIACLPTEMVRQYQVRILPVNIYFNGTVYRDGVDISPTEAYKMLERAPDRFASSPASAGDYLEVYREAGAQAESILCITLSSRLSTLYNMACVAKEEARNELFGKPIVVLDSRTVAGGEGLIVSAAARAAAEGKNLDEVINVAEAVRDRVNVIGVMQTVRHVYRTGRVPKIAAQAASIVNIKPMFAISQTMSEGVVRMTGLVRTREHGVKRALEMIKKKVGAKPVHVAIAHADVLEVGEALRHRIGSEFNCIELWLADFSPVMGYATGRGTLAIAFYSED